MGLSTHQIGLPPSLSAGSEALKQRVVRPVLAGDKIHYAFEHLELHRVTVDCDPANAASRRIAEKLGMRRDAHFVQNAWIKQAHDADPAAVSVPRTMPP